MPQPVVLITACPEHGTIARTPFPHVPDHVKAHMLAVTERLEQILHFQAFDCERDLSVAIEEGVVLGTSELSNVREGAFS